MLRLASLTTLALAALALAACKTETIANGEGGGGSSPGGSCTYDGKTYADGDSFPSTDGCNTCGCQAGQVACTAMGCVAACVQAGGSCDPITPEFCADGTVSDASCGSGVGVGCCFHDKTSCTAAGGTCDAITESFCADGTVGDASKYFCGVGVGVGCCFHNKTCGESCTTEGATRCSGGVIEVCKTDPATNCAPVWTAQSLCPDGESCNSDGTKCVAPVNSCTSPADCGCFCTCTSAGVCGECTGAIPSTCATDADCGPSCAGYRCIGGGCVQPVCAPGMDQTCNDDPAMSALAGTCNPDRTCTCKSGYTKKASGKCG